jgi:NAD(P)-dependent dehydrogenase (short-subunit alcohol dehydrogenase family)
MGSLDGKVVVITGAGSGIGHATALLLAEKGAKIHAVDVDPGLTQGVAAAIRSAGGVAEPHVVDCADAAAVEQLSAAVIEGDGHVDVLINNAGICVAGPVERLGLEAWRQAIAVNLLGVVHGVHFFAPQMIDQGEGLIVNVASAAGLVGFPFVSPYAASKFAVLGLSESLDAELASRGVKVSTICPGAVRTGILANGRLDLPGTWMDKVQRFFDRNAVSPELIARDIMAVIERPQGLKVRIGSAMRAAWMLKRLSPLLYRLAARMITRRALGDGVLPVTRQTS